MKVWLLENEQARWFEFEEPHDMPSDVTVTMLTETEQPAQRTWVGLTDGEILGVWQKAMVEDNGKHARLDNQPFVHFARAIEAKLKDKNT